VNSKAEKAQLKEELTASDTRNLKPETRNPRQRSTHLIASGIYQLGGYIYSTNLYHVLFVQ